MLLLAQVLRKSQNQQIEFRVLTRQHPDSRWTALETTEILSIPVSTLSTLIRYGEFVFQEGQLVLVEISEGGEVRSLEDAVPWIINFMSLVTRYDPDLAQQESERAEEWRQRLTLQTQELSRQRVEIETRRVQIQHIEESLKQERQELERQRFEIEAKLTELKSLEMDYQDASS